MADSPLQPCPRCGGSGSVIVCVLYPGDRYGLYQADCLACHGKGQVSEGERLQLGAEKACAVSEMGPELKRLRRLLRWDKRVGELTTVEIVVASTKL